MIIWSKYSQLWHREGLWSIVFGSEISVHNLWLYAYDEGDIVAQKEEDMPSRDREQRAKQNLEGSSLHLHVPAQPHHLTFRSSPCQTSPTRDYIQCLSLGVIPHIQTITSTKPCDMVGLWRKCWLFHNPNTKILVVILWRAPDPLHKRISARLKVLA